MEVKTIYNLPNEIIVTNVLVYLSCKDILSFGMSGNHRFIQLAQMVVRQRRKKDGRKEKGSVMDFFNLSIDFTPVIIKTSKDPSLKPTSFWS